jgi:hypothetical protein
MNNKISKFIPRYYCPYSNSTRDLYWNQKYCTCEICVQCCSEKEDRNLYSYHWPDYQIFKTEDEWNRRNPLYAFDPDEDETPYGIINCEGKHLEIIIIDGKTKCIHCAIDINDDAHETINPEYDLREKNE